jgi:hypothetical protein
MKKILLFLIVICAFASMNSAKAQCEIDISNVSITRVVGPNQVAGPPAGCEYIFNASFDIKTNGGFKYMFFHSWKTPEYVASFNCPANGNTPSTDIPTVATLGTAINDIGKSFMDFGFVNLPAVGVTPTFPTLTNITGNIATTYPAGGGVVLNNVGATATMYRKGTDTLHFDIIGIRVVLNGACPGTLGGVTTDIWGSNSASGVPKAQCYLCGRAQNFDNPLISLQKTCPAGSATGRWQLSLTNLTAAPVNASFQIYVDKNGNGTKEPTNGDSLIYQSGLVALPVNTLQSFGPIDLPHPYNSILPWANYGVYALVTVQGFQNAVETPVVASECTTLPVKLRSFDANRNKSNVDLKWVTEIETNNKGYYVERKLANGGWEQVTFVASQAPNGNSNSPLTYTLTDFNNTKGISQYRLRQVDIDGKQSYSQIRSVRGDGQKTNTIIYPNPSGDGKVNIVFEGTNSIRDVSLMDVSGKTLKQWKGVTNNNIHIDNLNAGFYTVRIVNTETGEQVVEKFIVNKR